MPMMRITPRFVGAPVEGAAFVVLFLLVALGGCKDDSCKTAADCGEMQQCIAGKCKSVSSPDSTEGDDSSSGSDSNSKDTLGDTSSENDTEDAGDMDTGSDTHGDSETTSDSDFQLGSRQAGESCDFNSDCASGHCDNDLCCPAGTCCATPGDGDDCPLLLCKTVYCDGNYQCRYFNLPVGTADLKDGESCDGQMLCDGEGECLSVSYCDSEAFKGTGTFTKDGDALQEGCRETCTSDSDCNEGYECQSGSCVLSSTGGDTDCGSDADCSSGSCDETLNVCCATGSCCVLDESCGRYSCNLETRMCNTQCLVDGEDYDAACSSLGDYHCDNGWCYDDLSNGAKWCDEGGDCLSEHCDSASAMCCSQGTCCEDDDDCDGMRCQTENGSYCPDTCAPLGTDDDTLCREYYVCESGVCVLETLENGEACDFDEACESSHCSNGYCCEEGECCASIDDCTQDLMCNVAACQGNNQCVYYAHSCGAQDIEGDDTCMGDNRCDGYGNCVTVSACEGGYIGDTLVCDEGVVAPECPTVCASDDDCVDSYHCEAEECIEDLSSGEQGCDSNLDCLDGHCNTVTGVCCASGYCCVSNEQCSAFLSICDSETDACQISCEGDSDCASFGDYHCRLGNCEPDLLNGEQFCLSDNECASGHCDEDSGICCGAGVCCVSDETCGGFACDESFSCVTDCTGDDNLCMDGWVCNLDVCEPKNPNGSLCASDADCASGHCDPDTSICCDSGEDCCLDASDCVTGDSCVIASCGASFACVYSVKSDGESCSDGAFCNGDERCSGGVCVAGADPCATDNFCIDATCDETADECQYAFVNEGEDCTEALFCIGNIAKKCTATGVCEDPGTGDPPCEGETGDPCTVFVCNETSDACDETAGADGAPCGSDPCDGDMFCSSGDCLLSGERPCDDDDLCTTDVCSVSGDEAVCGAHDTKTDGELCESDPCMGETATCSLGVCIPTADRPCIDNNLCTEDICEAVGNDYECSSETAAPRQMACGEVITIYSYEFSREIYAYNESCSGTYDGEEVAVIVTNSIDTVMYVTAAASPETDVEIMHLADLCDASGCTAHATGSLAVSASAENQVFVMESPDTAVPDEMEVSVTCE